MLLTQKILNAVAEHYRISIDDLRSRGRDAYRVLARHMAAFVLREIGAQSFPKIGRLLRRDHTTIIYAYKRVISELPSDEELQSDLRNIVRTVLGDEKGERWFIHRIQRQGPTEIHQLRIAVTKKTESPKKKRGLIAPQTSKDLLARALRTDNAKRDTHVLSLYREGWTLQKIGSAVGVSRERVRQIVRRSLLRELQARAEVGFDIDIDEYLKVEKERRIEKQRPASPPKDKSSQTKRWSQYYAQCRSCGTTNVPHVRKGLCEYCVGSVRGERRERLMTDLGEECRKCGMSRTAAKAKYGRDLYLLRNDGPPNQWTPLCRGCFQQTTGNKLGNYKRKDDGSTLKKIREAQREKIISDAGSQCEVCGISRAAARKKYVKDFFVMKPSTIGRRSIVLCQSCFQTVIAQRATRARQKTKKRGS